MAIYIKDIVAATPERRLLLHVVSIGSPQQTKTGKTVKPVTFLMKATSKQITENCFENAFKYDLAGVQPGMDVEAFIKDNGYLGYKLLRASAEHSETPTQSNYKQVQGERQATQFVESACKAEWKYCGCDRCETKRVEDEDRWSRDKISITLAMFVKENLRAGMKIQEALAEANKQRLAFLEEVERIQTLEKGGVDSAHAALDIFSTPSAS